MRINKFLIHFVCFLKTYTRLFTNSDLFIYFHYYYFFFFPRQKETVKLTLPKPATPSPNQGEGHNKKDSVDLESYFYGYILGDSTLGRDLCNYTFSCHICCVSCQKFEA